KALGVPLAADQSVWLHMPQLQDRQSVHIFHWNGVGADYLWGNLGTRIGGVAPDEWVDITPYVSATDDAWFGVEGMFFRNTGPVNNFDGYIDVKAELWQTVGDSSVLQTEDNMRMKVAPWIMTPHTQAMQEIWAYNSGGASSAQFLSTA